MNKCKHTGFWSSCCCTACGEYAPDICQAMQAERDALVEAVRWVPVSERLPVDGDWYLVIDSSVRHKVPLVTMGFLDGCLWLPLHEGGEDDIYVTHWKPLPTIPEEEL